MSKNYRYPGVDSFKTKDAPIFFGRERDTRELLQMIRLKDLVVLYGKSGLGKTSLINAGIIPALQQINATNAEEDGAMQYQMQTFRFFAQKDQDSQSPLATLTKETLGAAPKRHPLLEKIGSPTDNLWYHFKNQQLQHPQLSTHVLFFDQFEELFTYSLPQIEDFKAALATLINPHIPNDFKRQIREYSRSNPGALSRTEKAQLLQPIQVKVVMGIRSDRLSLLDKLSDYLPNVLVNLYELKALNPIQAKAAIVLPATQEGDFETQAFGYTETALANILNHLADKEDKIEPFQIQYICDHAESIVQGTNKTTLDNSDLGNLSKLFENYYHKKIIEIGNAPDQNRARQLLEDGLLFNGIRLSLLKDQIVSPQGFAIPPALLKRLEDVRLVRAEGRGEQTYFEITHDTLVQPILAAKEQRMLQERRKRRLLFGGIFIVSMLAALSGVLWIYGLYQTAELKQREAEKAKSEAEVAERQEKYAKIEAEKALKDLKKQNLVIEQQKDSIVNAFSDLKKALLRADEATQEALRQKGFADKNVQQYKKQFATYLMSEAQKAFELDDPRLTLRLTQEALKLDGDNVEAQEMIEEIPEYLSLFFPNSNEYRCSPDNTFITFSTDIKNNHGKLNILNLNTLKVKTFPNSYSKKYDHSASYSPDSKFIAFFTNVKDSNGELNILNLNTLRIKTFPTSYKFDFFHSYSYSPDSKFIAFFTNVKDERGVLNILNLKNNKFKKIQNCYVKGVSNKYSPNSQFITFFTNINNERGVLNILNLKNNKLKKIQNCYVNGDKYSPNSQFITFFTHVKNKYPTLNIFNLKNSNLKQFQNCYANSDKYSPNSQFITFFTHVKNKNPNLNILNLKNNKLKKFPRNDFYNSFIYKEQGIFENLINSKNYTYNYRYSSDSNFLTFFTHTDINEKKGILNILNLKNNKLKTFPNCYRHLYIEEMEDFYKYYYSYNYTSDNKYIIFFTYSENKKINLNILNLYDFSLKTFSNSYYNSVNYHELYKYNAKYNYIIYITNITKNKGNINILNLNNDKIKEFSDCYINKYNLVNDYSSDSKFFTFFTEIRDSKGNLNILNLENNKLKIFPNYLYERGYSYNSKNDLITFCTKKENKKSLNIVNLKNNELIFFSDYSNKRHHNIYKYSENSQFISFITTSQSLKTIELNNFQAIKTTRHQTKIEKFFYSEDSRYLFSCSNYPGSYNNGVLKITDLTIQGDLIEHYDTLYAPLSTEERKLYGLD